MADSPLKPLDYFWAPLSEAAIICFAGAIGYWIGKPILFASLGPTAYEQVEKSTLPSAHPYNNVIVGHLVGIAAGFAGLFIFHAWRQPHTLSSHVLTWPRIGAGVLAVGLTALVNIESRPARRICHDIAGGLGQLSNPFGRSHAGVGHCCRGRGGGTAAALASSPGAAAQRQPARFDRSGKQATMKHALVVMPCLRIMLLSPLRPRRQPALE